MGDRSGSTELPLGLTEEMRTTVLDNLSDGVYFVDRHRRILYWNRGAEEITGFSREEVLGRQCKDNILNHCDEAGNILCGRGCPLLATIRNGTQHEAHVYLHHKDGHRKPVAIRAAPIRDASGAIIGAAETFHDDTPLSDVRRRATELERDSMLDALTGVGNRRLGKAALSGWIEQLNGYGRGFGVLFADIDHFKKVNDTYGHDVGDEALRAVARTLEETSRMSDTVVRWGGDEFLVLAADTRPRTLELIAERVRALVSRAELFTRDGTVSVTVSIGATLAVTGDTAKRIVRRADALLYASKAAGRNRVTLDPFSRS
jgi:diguanylate cyclase (GGDEF)-like protein/PAS domain S-box-containing protein